jgi:hypothetical protein
MQHIWQITSLERQLSDGLILTASWNCNTVYSSSNRMSDGEYILPTKSPSDPDFVAYEDLTEEIVLAWVTGSINYLDIETTNSASVAEIISYEQNKTKDVGIPW